MTVKKHDELELKRIESLWKVTSSKAKRERERVLDVGGSAPRRRVLRSNAEGVVTSHRPQRRTAECSRRIE